jgi:aminomethyltransferase
MVPFAGWEMPVQYAGILSEHRAARRACGIFDVSHMGRLRVRGPGALASVQRAVSNDASLLTAGRCHYSLLLTEDAGIADDLFVYSPRGTADEVDLVVNACNTAKDCALIAAHLADAELSDETERTAMVAVQGPAAESLLAPLCDRDLSELRLHRYGPGSIAGLPAIVSRTGYTGEDGFEIVVRAEDADGLWGALRHAGATPCGLGARDVLRIEAGYPLWGHEIDEDTRPADAGLSRFCADGKGDYVGRAAHEDYVRAGPRTVLVGLAMKSKRIARENAEIRLSGEPVGRVTSGTFSPAVGAGVALGRIDNPARSPIEERRSVLLGSEVLCATGSALVDAAIVGLPFYRRGAAVS